METEAPSSSHQHTSVMSSGPMAHPSVRRAIYWALGVRTVADALPELLHIIVNSGKLSIAFFLGGYFVLVALWFPFWLFSFMVGEKGIYVMMIGAVFMIGRGVIRMIAFPGSSNRVTSEIEKEFAKYSVKMIINSTNTIIDLASAVSSAARGEASTTAYYDIVQLWNRSKSYRDRVLGVYMDVLNYILNNEQQSSNAHAPDLTGFGNNRLSGDIGDLSGLTDEARADGTVLLQKLSKLCTEMERLESQAKSLFENTSGRTQQISPAIATTATSMGIIASELRDFVESLRPARRDSGMDSDDEDELGADSVRRQFEEQSGSAMEAIKSGLSSILPMLDPPLHSSIFGFDVLRGCMLSRYRGARQLWVPRGQGGGMIDVIHIPAKTSAGPSSERGKKAVMYCNPNAGLIEVAAGMGLSGGTVDPDGGTTETCWSDFYTNIGFDIYLFNYAGFGRSHGAGCFGIGKRGGGEPYMHGAVGRMKRIFHSTFCGFQPTPDTLRADGLAVGSHILSDLGVDMMIIHGESIGGVAASFTAKELSQSSFAGDKLKLLICDRTFCNLEAVAQRLVGGWSGYAIRALAPFWSTDVANDFISAACPKIVANDAADAIIFDSASLKAGIAFWKEILRGSSSTSRVGWMIEGPIRYRMAVDYENVSVNSSRYAPSPLATRLTAPVWPQDKHVSLEEAFHFAACAKRIGKVASLEKKRFASTDTEAGMGGMECPAPIYQIWKYLGTCEGLCGAALGMAVRAGYDVTVSWLCSMLIFGGQTVVEGMEHRLKLTEDEVRAPGQVGAILPSDFDCRPPGYKSQESETTVHPKPIPEVIQELERVLKENTNDESLSSVSHEVGFVIGTLQYCFSRLGSQTVVEACFNDRHLIASSRERIGSFMNLHCGHNNPFGESEKKRLRSLVLQATSSHVAR